MGTNINVNEHNLFELFRLKHRWYGIKIVEEAKPRRERDNRLVSEAKNWMDRLDADIEALNKAFNEQEQAKELKTARADSKNMYHRQ